MNLYMVTHRHSGHALGEYDEWTDEISDDGHPNGILFGAADEALIEAIKLGIPSDTVVVVPYLWEKRNGRWGLSRAVDEC